MLGVMVTWWAPAIQAYKDIIKTSSLIGRNTWNYLPLQRVTCYKPAYIYIDCFNLQIGFLLAWPFFPLSFSTSTHFRTQITLSQNPLVDHGHLPVCSTKGANGRGKRFSLTLRAWDPKMPEMEVEKKHSQNDSCKYQWTGLRENLQETMVFTIKYRGFL